MINNYIWTKSCRVVSPTHKVINNKLCKDIENDYYKCIEYNLLNTNYRKPKIISNHEFCIGISPSER